MSEGKFGVRAECCGLWSWGYKPLVNKATHVARIRAHEAFDRLWMSRKMGRGEAYRRLQIAMGLDHTRCHISQFDVDQALAVVDLVRDGRLEQEP